MRDQGANDRRGDDIVDPAGAARPGMRYRRQQDQSPHRLRILKRIGGGERARPGMSQHDRTPHAEAGQRLMHKRGLRCRRGVGGAARAVAPAMAWPVDQDDAVALRQPVAERQPHVGEVAARAVQQHDRRRIARSKFEDMETSAIDIDETSGRRIAALDRIGAGQRHAGQYRDDNGQAKKDHSGAVDEMHNNLYSFKSLLDHGMTNGIAAR
jgi:hypothetical protein